MEEIDSITERIIGCCFEVHKEIGPGFNNAFLKASGVHVGLLINFGNKSRQVKIVF
jgi:hypothetical protein